MVMLLRRHFHATSMAPGVRIDQLTGESSPAMSTFLTVILTVILLFLLRYFTRARTQHERAKLPPSPPALPLIGHFHLTGALPHVSLRDLATKYASNGLMMLRIGVVPTLVVSSPHAAQEVLRTHDQLFASRPRSIFSDVLAYGPTDVGLQPYGEGWKKARKLVTTHLLSTKKVQSFRAIQEEEVALVIDKVRSAVTECATVDMSELLNGFTNGIVCRAVAGQSFKVKERDRVCRELIEAGVTLLGGFNLENLYPELSKVAGGMLMWRGLRKVERLRDRWDELLDALIDERASEVGTGCGLQKANGCEEGQNRDFMQVLLSVKEEYGLTTDSIKAISSGMLVPGTETSFVLLECTMAELMLHRDIMAKLQAEVRSVCNGQEAISEDYLAQMKYLKAVIKETLRLHPPLALLTHFSMEDCYVDGYMVPAGTTVIVNVWAIGRDPEVWAAAETFMPDRFIENGGLGDIDFKGHDFQFLPFGSGRRICPGINFAITSAEIMLANLLCHFDWDLPKGVGGIDMTEEFGLTIKRKEKLFLQPRSRGDSI